MPLTAKFRPILNLCYSERMPLTAKFRPILNLCYSESSFVLKQYWNSNTNNSMALITLGPRTILILFLNFRDFEPQHSHNLYACKRILYTIQQHCLCENFSSKLHERYPFLRFIPTHNASSQHLLLITFFE